MLRDLSFSDWPRVTFNQTIFEKPNEASSLATVAWSACNNVGNNGANRYFQD